MTYERRALPRPARSPRRRELAFAAQSGDIETLGRPLPQRAGALSDERVRHVQTKPLEYLGRDRGVVAFDRRRARLLRELLAALVDEHGNVVVPGRRQAEQPLQVNVCR